MIKKNQRFLNGINIASDGVIVYLMLPMAYWLRFSVLPGGVVGVPLRSYLTVGLALTAVQLFAYAAFGLYRSFRSVPLSRELSRLWGATLLVLTLLMSWLFVQKGMHYSRLTLALWFGLTVCALSGKRVCLRRTLRRLRAGGYNQKQVLILGNGPMAQRYLAVIRDRRELGYQAIGYVDAEPGTGTDLPYLGGFDALEALLEEHRPDEAVSAIEMEDYPRMPQIIAACEKAGVKLSIIPFYADYMPSTPQFDHVGSIPLLNLRHIPLDNWANAFVKRAMDLAGAGLLLALTSPLLLVCAVGVKLSSPGPVLFKQDRVGRNKRVFKMYKFRSMRVNDGQDTGWSQSRDDRRTPFGAVLRKLSLDELPQLLNVLRGDMSLVGPRPEVPYYVEQFREEVPLYMVKHQVRPGMTGLAQVNGFRGDTSIRGRVEHDVYYIEHWSVWLDLKILFLTVFGGRFVNGETLR